MKNTFLIILACFFAFTACDNEVDEIFEQSSQERVNAAKIEYKKILTSSENGWHIATVPGEEFMGEFNAYAVFKEDGMAYVANDFNPYNIENKIDSSLYEIRYTQGMTITFTTFSQMNYFSNPNNSRGEGRGGDIELLVREISEDKIVCEGKVNKGTYIFTKAKSKLHIDALDEVKEMEVALIKKAYLSDYAFPSLSLANGKKYGFTYNSLYRAVIIEDYVETAEGIRVEETIHRIGFDGEGMFFIDPIVVGNDEITRLNYDAEADEFKTPADQIEAQFVIEPWPPVQVKGIAQRFSRMSFGIVNRYGKTVKSMVEDYRMLYPDFEDLQFYNESWMSGLTFKFKPYYFPYAKFKDNKIDILADDTFRFEFDRYVDKSTHPHFTLEDRVDNPEGQALIDFFFDEGGFKLYTTDYKYYYAISVNDPTKWLIIAALQVKS